MLAYIARRLAFAIFLVFAVSSASLVLARLAPGDFVSQSVGLNASPEAIAEARARFGLNRSIVEQYRLWIAGAARCIPGPAASSRMKRCRCSICPQPL